MSSKRKKFTNNSKQINNDDEAIQYLISSRNEMVKALKKVLDQINKKNDKASGNN